MRSAAVLAFGTTLALTVAACGPAAVATQTSSPPAATQVPSSLAPIPPSPNATASPAALATPPQPLLSGDAATNAACRLATVAEISGQVRAGVREMRGLTSPGAYAETSLSCAWYLDSTDIGIPSVVVQWEFPVVNFHDAVVDLYRLIVKQELATEVADVGEMAILQGATAEAIDGERIVRVSVLQHIEPTESDKQDAVALLQLFLERTAQP